jgi:hypothetical protein
MFAAKQSFGILSISTLETSCSGRSTLVAYLKDPEVRYGRGIMFPLFDVQVVKLTQKGMLLVCYQIEAQPIDGDGKCITTEYVQGWWAKFVVDVPR